MSTFATFALPEFAPAEPGEAKESIDSLMRTAYTSWSQKCRINNIPTTPAYDVVGLLAILHPEKFNIDGNVMSLKEKFRGPDGFQPDDYNTSKLAGTTSKLAGTNLIVLTDFGEECDDEVTSLLVPESAKLVFTDENHFDKNVAKYREFGGKCTVHHVSELSELFKDDNNVVLQIGPVHNAAHGVIDVSDKKYDWYLVGTIGGTLNSKGDAQENAEILRDSAQSAYIIDTARGKGAFPFTYDQLKSALSGRITAGQLEKIAEHVIKIGWRNTVGRANPFVGKFISHLVVKNKGANYKTVDTVLRACLSPEKIAEESWTSVAATKLAENYLARLQTTAPDSLDPSYDEVKMKQNNDDNDEVDDGTLKTFKLKGSPEDTAVQEGVVQFRVPHTDVKPQKFRLLVDGEGKTNSTAGVTADQIVEGYTFILVVLNKLFGVPIEFFESGQPGKWQPQWENPGWARPYPFVKTI